MRDDPGSSLPVILMGFSRGGLVLNQILIEMGTAVYSDSIMQRVQEIHWLDCGNGVRGMCYPNIENKPASFLRYYKCDYVETVIRSKSLREIGRAHV